MTKFTNVKLTHQNGFTLTEVLLVISMIGIVTAAALAVINPAQRIAEANDSERLKSFGAIRNALQAYYTKNQHFPKPNDDPSRGNWDASDVDSFIQGLKDQQFLKQVPVDPINDEQFHFAYYRFDAGHGGCNPASGPYIVFGIRNLESTAKRASEYDDQQAGAWSCPGGRNFGDEFAYVYGAFEK